MKVQFVRTPPQEYASYIEGETVDLPDQEARNLLGLGIVAQPRGGDGDTRMVSNRTEIVGTTSNDTQVVVEGRGANIVRVRSPETDKLVPTAELDQQRLADAPTAEQRTAAERAEAEALVKQEAGRTGGFEDETKPVSVKRTAKSQKAAPENK